MKISVRFISRKNIGLLLLGIGFVGSLATNANAQDGRDPFAKPVVRVVNNKVKVGALPKPPKVGPSVVAPPSIQSRIEVYRSYRVRCAELNVPCPKPTSVLTLDEMQVTGIFRTPRGYAAMVEASPLNPKLSYTIYPGEKFYDGQLIAIEDAKLVFRRTVRMSDGKEIVASADKILRQETVNDLAAARPEAQMQTNAPKAAAAPEGTTSPQMSADAVPQSAQKEGEPVSNGTKVNSSEPEQNNVQPTENPAAKDAVPATGVETNSNAVPAPSKTKTKSKPRSKKNP